MGNRQSGSRSAARPRGPVPLFFASGAVTDIVPVTASHNVVADIKNDNGTTHYNANQVLGGTSPGKFVSALWDYPSEQSTALAISFGTDCTTAPGFGVTDCTQTTALKTKIGWDNVTGVGTPNAKAFADSFAPPAARTK
jgi:hypothetical protein